ncbi:SprT family zinc-dependent metalloprotease [Aliiglaciecola sp. LCG003]|uniref:SprT family zinc-dependent metalloprotease n=1 Tax=Aliiglaciecola sp. LCG003 TaxID=3053655 RepID=UPI0025736916|nr:SprT family zinc-dependent metalloprotease [Aliiglaciecola sp. LCG003]WJG11083.1 SprT family zinc-dependent metalloprotease [Aliiglaciecola sp. LCG003]
MPTLSSILSFEQKQAARLTVNQFIDLANNSLSIKLNYPDLAFNQRGKIAGTAHLHKHLIKLNPVLLKDNEASFHDEVIAHEVAHIVTFHLFGKVRPHGPEWRHIMQHVFKKPAKTTHKMDTTKTQGQTVEYRCECGPVALSIRRHNKVIRHKQSYICRVCRQSLSEAIVRTNVG